MTPGAATWLRISAQTTALRLMCAFLLSSDGILVKFIVKFPFISALYLDGAIAVDIFSWPLFAASDCAHAVGVF